MGAATEAMQQLVRKSLPADDAIVFATLLLNLHQPLLVGATHDGVGEGALDVALFCGLSTKAERSRIWELVDARLGADKTFFAAYQGGSGGGRLAIGLDVKINLG